LLTDFFNYENIFSLAKEFNINQLKIDIMKKLTMVLALAFTMGLAASSVSASTKDVKKKDKAATTATCAKAAECSSKAKKACCPAPKTEETAAPAPAKK
jgi:hypothetical protein